MDILTSDQRSALMSRIRGKDTAIELMVRHALHARGLRYRLGGAGLPGRPDLVLPRYRTVVFVNGCFWHGNDCHLFRLPKTRTLFWREKIEATRARDRRTLEALMETGWHAHVLWECSLRGVCKDGRDILLDELSMRIRSGI